MKATLIRRDAKTVTVRTEDGAERTFPGKHVLMVYCREYDLDAQIEQRPHRQTEVDATIDGETLLLCGTALYA